MLKSTAKVNMLRQDWLLIIAIILAPMTDLRIWKVGPAEALCLLWCVMQYRQMLRIRFRDPFLIFWFTFLCVSLIGTCYGEWFYPEQSNIKGLATWCYFAVVSLATYSGLKQRSAEQLTAILRWASCGAAVWYFALYLYSLYVSPYFFGTNLWYGYRYRFSGGASNPHQVAMLLCVVALVLLYLAIEDEKGIRRCGLFAAGCVAVFLLFQTRSSTAIAAAVCGAAVVVLKLVFRTVLRSSRSRILFLAVVLVFCLLFGEEIFEWVMRWVASDANGMGRFEIFAQFPDAFWKSPVFGLGPGNHVTVGDVNEFHNTYLEIFAMGGLVGITIFMWFSITLFKKIFHSPCSLAIATALYAYGLAGFGARRLIYWIMISFAVCIAEKRHNEGQVNCKKIKYSNISA